MSKVGNDIRRISGYEKLLKLAREAQETADQAKKLSIENRKHIAYLDNKTLTTTSEQGTSGTSKPTGGSNNQTAANKIGGIDGNIWNAGTGTSLDANDGGQAYANSQENPLNGAADMGSSEDAGGDDTSDKEGEHDAESTVNNDNDENSGDKEPPVTSGNTTPPNQSTNNQYTGQKINRLTGAKTEDGRQLIIGIGSIGAIAWVGPSDWDDAFNGPDDPTFEFNKVWAISFGAEMIIKATFSAMVKTREDAEGVKCYGVAGGFITHTTPISGGDLQFSPVLDAEIGQPTGPLGGTVYAYETYSPGVMIPGVGKYGMEDCDLRSDLCGIPTPKVEFWTDLGVTQLGWISGIVNDIVGFSKEYIGRFMPHPADVNVPSEYVGGASILDFLGTKTDMPIRLGPLREGGFYLYERDPDNSNLPVGDPTENSVTIIRANGTVAGRITPNQLSTMLPL